MKRLFAIAASALLSVSALAQKTELEEFQFDFMFNQALSKRLQQKYNEAFTTYQNCLKLNEKSAAAWYELSRLFILSQDNVKALSCAEQALKCDANDVTLIRHALDLNLSLNRTDRCIVLLNSILKIDSTDVASAVMLERLYTSKKDFAKALNALKKADNGELSRQEFLELEKCDIYLKCKGPKEAKKYIKTLIKKNPQKSIFVSSLGSYYVQVGDTANAIKQYLQASKMKGGQHFAFDYLDLAMSSLKKADFDQKMIAAFSDQSIEFDYKFALLAKYTDVKNDLKKNPRIEALLDSMIGIAIEQYPSEEDLYKMAALNSLRRHNDEQSAKQYYEKYFTFSAGTPQDWSFFLTLLGSDEVEKQRKYIDQAYYYYPADPYISFCHVFFLTRDAKYDEAYSVAKEMIETIRDNKAMLDYIGVRYYDIFANICYELKKKDECFEAYDSLLKLDEYNVLALNNYAYYLSENDLNLDRAEQMSRTATSLEPNNPVYQDTYAWVLYKKGLYADAKFVMDLCINLLSDSISEVERSLYFDHYGDILFAAGYTDAALQQWKKALELDPSQESISSKIKAHE